MRLDEIGNYGLSTRAVSAPIGSGRRGGMRPVKKWVPLSQFFLNMEKGGEDEPEKVMGFKEPEKGKKAAKRANEKANKKKAPRVPKIEGTTTSANVATTAVPIGPGIDHVTDILDFAPGHPYHRKKKRKKKLSRTLGALLKRRNPVA